MTDPYDDGEGHGGSPREAFDPDQMIGPDDVLPGADPMVGLNDHLYDVPDADDDGDDFQTYRVVRADGSIYRTIHLRTDADLSVSDGHHTFDELYDHRRKLTAVLATIGAVNGDSWRSKDHHPTDGPMFEGSFIVGIELPAGPITYHYPLDSWDEFAAVEVLEHAPKWDGAGPAETLVRLADFAAHLKAAIDEGRAVQEQARAAAEQIHREGAAEDTGQ